MIGTQFESILKELEVFFHCPLKPDLNNSCLIKMGIGVSVQCEIDVYGMLVLGCELGVLPMNRYRDNLIREALKANHNNVSQSEGVFGFSSKSYNLILFLFIDPNKLNHELMFTLFPPFIEKAKKWKEAIEKGETPVVIQMSSEVSSSHGMFGLIH